MERHYRVVCIATLAALAMLWMAAPASAQNAELPPPPIGPAPGEGIPNLNGVWDGPSILNEAAVRRALGGRLPPFTPYGQEMWDNRDLAADPTGYCQPSGTGRVLHSPQLFQIVQSDGQVTFLFEIYHQFHRVFVDGRDHPEPLDITWWGSSIGRYEGNKLVFETIGLDARSWLFTAGFQHSEQLKLIHVFEKTGPDTIRITETFEDPVFFTEPWSISYDVERQPFDMMEGICTDNNRDINFFVPRSSR